MDSHLRWQPSYYIIIRLGHLLVYICVYSFSLFFDCRNSGYFCIGSLLSTGPSPLNRGFLSRQSHYLIVMMKQLRSTASFRHCGSDKVCKTRYIYVQIYESYVSVDREIENSYQSKGPTICLNFDAITIGLRHAKFPHVSILGST